MEPRASRGKIPQKNVGFRRARSSSGWEAKNGRNRDGSLGMSVQEQIDKYIGDQRPPKRRELQDLHRRIMGMSPECKLWFLDGRNREGKIVSNPNIGYGSTNIKYVNGEQREFYRVGLSANTTGISVYIMGLDRKDYLPETYGKRLGKAKISGYCVKFKSIRDVNIETLEEIIADAMTRRPT